MWMSTVLAVVGAGVGSASPSVAVSVASGARASSGSLDTVDALISETRMPSSAIPVGVSCGFDTCAETASVTAVPIAPTATIAIAPRMIRRMMRTLDCCACTFCAFSRTASRELRGVGTFGVSSLDIVPLESLGGAGWPRPPIGPANAAGKRPRSMLTSQAEKYPDAPASAILIPTR